MAKVNKNHKKQLIDAVERKHLFPLSFKAISGAFGGTTELVALYILPISIVEIIYNSQTIYVTIIALTCIKENTRKVDILNVIFSFSGLILICMGESSKNLEVSETTIYIGYAFLFATSILQGFGLHAMRKIKSLPSLTLFYYQNCTRIALVLIYELFILQDSSKGLAYVKNFDTATWLLLIFMGISQQFAQ